MKHNYLSVAAMTAALMATATTLSAYDNVSATIAWPVGNESDGTVTEAVADAVSLTKVTVGTDLQITSTSATYTLGDVTAGPYVTYLPSTSNPGCVSTDMIEYTVQVKKGITFTPTSFVFDAVKEGTDNAYFSWSYTVDGVESDIVAYSDPKNQIRRNNNANPSAPLTHTEEVTAEGGQKVTLRFYISNVANNKKMSIGNIQINGTVDGEEEARAFKNFELNFMNISELPAKPEGVITLEGTPRNDSHGLNSDFKLVVPVDGPVKITLGGCQYSGTNAKVMDGETLLTEIDVKTPGCYHNGGTASWIYNSETATTLTVIGAQYNPYIKMEACDLIPMRTVTYYDTDGKTIVGAEEVEGGSALAYKYGASDLAPFSQDCAFRGWFNSTQASAVKVAEGTSVQENLNLYAKVTPIEVATIGSIFTYPLNSTSFYIEDHELITSTGTFHDAQHGYGFGAGQNVAVQVAGNAVVVFGCCQYGNAGTILVTDADGATVGEITIPVEMGTDGATNSISYEGDATTLTATFTNGGYLHNVTVYNVEEIPEKEETGYYYINPGDGASLQLVLAALQEGDKIFLPNGVYDFGEKALTTISANNVSIIGESMEGTIIRNAPDKSTEGIGTTATLLNTSNGLYLQDLTLQNALDYYASGSAGRAVCLQDKGANTICKNVRMLSYQDTYYSNKASNFYWEDSEIHGTVDYLCGDGDVVYNRCKFVNESRDKNSKSGSDVIAAPYTSAQCIWGYVFLDCTVTSESKDFTFARSWGGNSTAQFIRTKVADNSLNASRWSTAGMNVPAYQFKEYGTMDADGNVTTPASNVVTFTHSSGNRIYETVLTDEEAAQYTVANIYNEWQPDSIAAQVEISEEAGPEEYATISDTYLITGEYEDVSMHSIVPAEELYDAVYMVIEETDGQMAIYARAANGRGGFGPARVIYEPEVVSVDKVSAASAAAPVFDLNGRQVANVVAGQLYFQGGRKFIAK